MLKRKDIVKQLWTLTEEKVPGTKYDRYFFEEFVKKFKTTVEIESILGKLREVTGTAEEFKHEIEEIIFQYHSKAEQLRIQQRKEEESKKVVENKKGEWTHDEL